MFRVARLLVVWLTAATTLLAGTPRLACQCPDGSRKPFCFAFLTSTTTGCCNESDDQSDEDPPPCCRQVCKKAQSPDRDEGTTVRPLDCQKHFVQPEAASVEKTQQDVTVVAVDMMMGAAAPPESLAGSTWIASARAASGTAPPADLIVLLQHFTL